jgi:glutamate/tyrosine decarboxylase-like PLP-dependent enzyme
MNPSCAGGDQAAVHLENLVVGWLAQLIGYPGGGVLVSGGSAGALTALAAARHRAALADGWDDRVEGMGGKRAADLRLYVSDEGHSSLRKAAQLLGFGDNGVRIMPTDRAGRLLIEPLAAAVEGDRAGGRRPFCVVASAGVVGTGVIDPLADVAELCRRNGMWFHVDGSLGGFGVLDPGVRSRFRGMEAADSVVLDPHKWLSVPIDCAALLVGQLDDLRSTFSLVPSYVRSREGDEPWFSEYVFDQTRPFRALKLWATMAAAGRDELGARIGRSIARARRLAGQVTAAPELELLAEPELCVVAFRLASASDETNRRLPEVVQRMGDVFLTGAKVDGREAIRACFMHDATTDADVDRIVPAVLAAARSMTEGPLSP